MLTLVLDSVRCDTGLRLGSVRYFRSECAIKGEEHAFNDNAYVSRTSKYYDRGRFQTTSSHFDYPISCLQETTDWDIVKLTYITSRYVWADLPSSCLGFGFDQLPIRAWHCFNSNRNGPNDERDRSWKIPGFVHTFMF